MRQTPKTNFTFRKLTNDDLDTILHTQQIVVDSLEDPSVLSALTPDEYTYIFNGNGVVIGAFHDDSLIALRAVLEPPIDDEHLGIDLGLAGEELTHVLYQEISMVLPSYRGQRLQQQLAKHIMEIVQQSDKEYTYICATVAPMNIPSLKDKFNQGMVTVILQPKYGEKWRYTFAKPLKETWELDNTEIKTIPLHERDEHVRLLQEGWYGVNLLSRDEQFFISYQRKL